MIPVDERKITDEELFAAFDLDYPGLEEVKASVGQGEWTKAKQALLRYFETRTNVRYFYDYRALPLRPVDTDSNPYLFQSSMGLQGSLKDFCLFAGEKMMQHIYVRPGRERKELDLGAAYENLPHFNYFEDQGKKTRETLDIFVRGVFMEYFSILYHETGNPAVVEGAEQFLRVFWQTYPLQVECTEPDISHFSLQEERDVMSAGWLALNYISLLYTRLPYEMPVEAAFELVKHLWFLGVQFRRFDADSYRKYNHHMWERGQVPFILGTLFPEIPAFAGMKEHGAQVIRHHIRDDFNTSGGYSEHSIPYWSGAALAEMICRAVYLSRLNQEPLLDDDTQSRIYKSFDVLAQISAPGAFYPSIGDNGGPQIEPILRAGADAVANHFCEEVLALRSGRAQVQSDIPLDYCNDKVGFFCSRSSLAADANYILMSAKINCGSTGHNHMDMLSLSVSIRGEEMIGEPYARALYHTVAVGSPLRGYMYNMSSHNTVLTYGIPIQPDSIYASKWGVIRPDSPVEAFAAEDNGCYVKAYHDAYTHSRHIREVLCCRSRGFLIRDTILGGNRSQKANIQRWNLMQGVACTQLDGHTVLLEKNGAKALMLWSGNPALHIWQKKDLCPVVEKEEDKLAWIIDAEFQEKEFTPAGGMEPVCQSVLILDAAVRAPQAGQLDTFYAQAMTQAETGGLKKALELFETL